MSEKIIRSMCGFCHSNCGIKVHVKDGKVTDIEPDLDHPATRGFVCPKASALKPMLESKERLQYPLKKVNGKQVRVSWDEALNFAAEKLTKIKQTYGPESLVLCGGAPVTYGARDGFLQFLGTFGSPNATGAGNLCAIPRRLAFMDAYGNRPEPDFEHANLIIFWGSNPANTFRISSFAAYGGLHQIIPAAKKMGKKIIAIDPVRSETAAQADQWIHPKIGTDTALGLAMANVIIKENLYNKAFVDKWVLKFDEIKKHVEPLTPEWAEKITAVPADTIRELARVYAKTDGAVIVDGNGMDMHTNGVDMVRTVGILIALTGNVDKKGTNVFFSFVPQIPLPTIRPEKKRIAQDEYPLFPLIPFPALKETLIKEAPGYPRAMIVHHANPVLVQANVERTKQALKKLEFLMVLDIFPTATTEMADLVLPVAADLEAVDYRTFSSGQGGFVALREKVVEPMGEARSVFEVEYDLAKRMGMEASYPFKNAEEWIDFVLRPIKVTLADLREKHAIYATPAVVYNKYEKDGFMTPSKKIECYSERFEKLGCHALPVFEEPNESPVTNPELAKKFDLLATTRRPAEFVHTKLANLQTAGRKYPDPLVKINPADAKKRGIGEGNVVEVESARGKVTFKAKVTDDVMPGMITIDFGFGNPTDNKGSINKLTSDSVWDKPSGGYPNRLFMVAVKKAA